MSNQERDNLRALVTAQEREIRRLRKDKARLDWLDQKNGCGRFFKVLGWFDREDPRPGLPRSFSSLRNAIDAARSNKGADIERGEA